jgi:hypothetical protein
MKSVISKRWYFIFLIIILSIHTFSTFKEIIQYKYWNHPYWLYFTIALFQLIVWYCIIKMNPKLWWAIVGLVCLVLLDASFQLSWIIAHLNEGRFLVKFIIYIAPFLFLAIAGKKYIKVQEKSN